MSYSDPRRAFVIAEGLLDLCRVRDNLRAAGAEKAADAVQRAIKSAEGAYRHASGGFCRWRDQLAPRELRDAWGILLSRQAE
jgi:hypothetical protein